MNPDFSNLEQALSILYMPSGANSQQLMMQAQEYTQTFLQPYRQNLPALLTLYEDPAT